MTPSSRQILAVLGDDIDIDILALRANYIIQQQQAINVTTKPNNTSNKNQDNQDIYPDKKWNCYYHSIFGSKSRKCKQPCSY